jgi:hypothetical protein
MLVDSDVVFKQVPTDFTDGYAYGSDCSSYLSAVYLDGCDPRLLGTLCSITGISPEYVRGKKVSPGAQYALPHLMGKGFWEKVETDSIRMYAALVRFNCSIHPVQVWTASMWAILYNLYALEITGGLVVDTHPALDFCFATDPATLWESRNILHCAGVHKPQHGYFYKGAYTTQSPFKSALPYVDKGNCSSIYVDKISEYKTVRRAELCH